MYRPWQLPHLNRALVEEDFSDRLFVKRSDGTNCGPVLIDVRRLRMRAESQKNKTNGDSEVTKIEEIVPR